MENYRVNLFCTNCQHCVKRNGVCNPEYFCNVDYKMPIERHEFDNEMKKLWKKWSMTHKVQEFGTCDRHNLICQGI